MDATVSDRATRLVRLLGLVVLVVLLTQVPRLFGHVSLRKPVVGRYSYSYALALGGYVALMGAAGGVVVWAPVICRALAGHLRVVARGLAVFTGALVSILVLEVVLRLSDPYGLQYFTSVDRYLLTLDRETAPLAFRNRAGLRMVLEGIEISISSQGLRDRDYAVAKLAGTSRIMMLGDSVVFGWGVRAEDTFAKQLERLLTEQGQKVEVLNTGVPWYDPRDEALYFRTIGVHFQPDVVLLTVTTDDYLGRAPEQHSFDVRNIVLDLLKGMAVRSRVAGTVFMALFPILDRSQEITVTAHPGWPEIQNALENIVADARRVGSEVAIAHFRVERDRLAEQVHDLLWRECGRLAVPCVDYLEAFRERPVSALRISRADPHPTATAHRLIAEQWQAFLTERGWVGRTRSSTGWAQR